MEPGKCFCYVPASFQPAFAVSVDFMVSSVSHDGWDEAFEAVAGALTSVGWHKGWMDSFRPL